MPTGTTDLAPILAMLDDCGFTNQHTGRAPTGYFYRGTFGEQDIDVTVYPWGNKQERPATPEPCVTVSALASATRGYTPPLWRTDFRAGTPARVIIAALSAAMHDAAGTRLPVLPVRVIVTYPDVEAAGAARIDHVEVQSLYTATPDLDETQVSYVREVPR